MKNNNVLWQALLLITLACHVQASPQQALTLAKNLAETGDHAQAALEYRRLALETESLKEKGVLYWMAGHEYTQAKRHGQAVRMLGKAEDATQDLEAESYLLHAEISRGHKRLKEAEFYLEGLLDTNAEKDMKRLAAKRLTSVRLQMHDYTRARQALQTIEAPSQGELDAITTYENGKDKSPVTGGL